MNCPWADSSDDTANNGADGGAERWEEAEGVEVGVGETDGPLGGCSCGCSGDDGFVFVESDKVVAF